MFIFGAGEFGTGTVKSVAVGFVGGSGVVGRAFSGEPVATDFSVLSGGGSGGRVKIFVASMSADLILSTGGRAGDPGIPNSRPACTAAAIVAGRMK